MARARGGRHHFTPLLRRARFNLTLSSVDTRAHRGTLPNSHALHPLWAGAIFASGQAHRPFRISGTAEETRGAALRILELTRPTADVPCTYQSSFTALTGSLRNLQARTAFVYLSIHGTQTDNPLAHSQGAAGETLPAVLVRHALARGAEGFHEEQSRQADQRRIAVFITSAMAVETAKLSMRCGRKPGNKLALLILGIQPP